jgi:lactate permease
VAGGGALREIVPGWLRTARKASPGVLLLASVATVMADSGMMRILAVGVAAVAQDAYPPMAGLVGALGSFTTGSTTSSNALFATLQTDVARLLDVPPTTLLAAQLAGGNIGNSLTPVIMLLGAAAVDARDQVGAVLRTVALPVGVLLAVIVALTQALVLLS